MSCVSLLGAFHVKPPSTASGSGLTPCLFTILPRYLIESLRISHFDALTFKPALFMHSKNLIESINVICQGGCCYDHVIHVTHHKIPVLLCYSGQSLSLQSLKGRRGYNPSPTGTTPIHMRIRSFICPFSAEGPARRQSLSPVW